MSRDEVQRHMSSSGMPQFDKVTVSAAILRHDTSGPSVLLLKRNPNEKYYLNVFEIPGGKVDATDRTVHDAAIREVAEETQLRVLNITASLFRMPYTTEKLERRTFRSTQRSTPWEFGRAVIPMTSEMRTLVLEILGLEEDRSEAK